MTKMLNDKNTIPEFSTNEDFKKLFEDFSEKHEKKEGTITTGTITNISKDEIKVDIGIKDEGTISVKEFVQNGKLPKLLHDFFNNYQRLYNMRHNKELPPVLFAKFKNNLLKSTGFVLK